MRAPFQAGSLLLHPKWRPFAILLRLGLRFLLLLHCYLYHIRLRCQEDRHLLFGQRFPLAQCLNGINNFTLKPVELVLTFYQIAYIIILFSVR